MADLVVKLDPAAAGDAMEREIVGEQAAALGRQGKLLEAALAALEKAEGPARDTLLTEAADAVWRMMIQREAMGLRHHRDILRYYGVPRAVELRIGVSRAAPPPKP